MIAVLIDFLDVLDFLTVSSCYTAVMISFPFWPKKKEKKKGVAIKRVIVGFIIGGAIASIIGKKLLHSEDKEEENDD